MEFFKKNKKIILTLAACGLLVAGISGTYAILTAQTKEVVNAFELEDVNTRIDEDIPPDQVVEADTTLTKKVTIINDGPADAFIRARVTVSPSGTATVTDLAEVTKDDAWVDGGDDWYYYMKVVPAGKATTELFTTVKTAADLNENFDVTVYQEAVGTGSYTVNSTDIKVEKIKDLFDNITTKQDGN